MTTRKTKKEEPQSPPNQEEPLFSQSYFYPARPQPPYWVRLLMSGAMGLAMVALLCLAAYGTYSLLFPQTYSPSTSDDEISDDLEVGDTDFLPPAPSLQDPVAVGPTVNLQVEMRPVTVAQTGDYVNKELAPQKIARDTMPSLVSLQQYQATTDSVLHVGTGFIISEDGYIVTAAHLLSGGNVYVQLHNGMQHLATIVGTDNRTDLVVLKISANNLIPVVFGNSDQLELGEEVIALGRLGSDGYLTRGVVSCVARELKPTETAGYTLSCIQTDLSVNDSNAGGPLLDAYGRVMGVCSTRIGQEAYPQSGFAIPSSTILSVTSDLIAYGRVTGRVWLGMGAVEITADLANRNHLPRGILISTIYEGSNLTDAGLQAGDVLYEINNESIESLADLRQQLDKFSPGDLIQLQVYRPLGAGRGTTMHVSIYLLEDMGSFANDLSEFEIVQ